MATYLKVPQKTLFKGKAWLNPKYIKSAIWQNKDLLLEHKGKYMLIKRENIKKENFEKGDREYADSFGGEPYYLYGIHFVDNYKIEK